MITASKLQKLLIADDSPNILKLFSYNLERMGYKVVMARDGEETLEELKLNPDVLAVLLDINMPHMSGIEALEILKKDHPDLPVIMVTALNDVQLAVKAIKMGAYEYITKPVDFDLLETVLKNAIEMGELKTEVKQIKHDLHENDLFTGIIGQSKDLQNVFRIIEKVMKTNVNVMIIGESGTGKDLLANALHNGSNRRKGPFVTVNCAAITSQLAESLLFGHKKGSFTGAATDSIGFFEQADGGTIFLDEIGDMPLDIQVKVLRVLENRQIRRVGEQSVKDVDFRVIAATNRDLAEAVTSGDFREDLYFRLEEYPVYLPPLRERKEDIPLLANYFLEDLIDAENLPHLEFSRQALQEMREHPWPGNIRELKNVVRRSALLAVQGEIQELTFTHLGQSEKSLPQHRSRTIQAPASHKNITPMEETERQEIEKAYLYADKNAVKAARLLGISRATMYRKLKNYNVK